MTINFLEKILIIIVAALRLPLGVGAGIALYYGDWQLLTWFAMFLLCNVVVCMHTEGGADGSL